MIKIYFKRILSLFFAVILVCMHLKNLKADNVSYVISKPEVFKRNKASCNRLGNIYDACQWMTRFVVTNKGEDKISNICVYMKVNTKAYELCYGKTKRISIKPNTKKTFLVNLTELVKVPNESEKPYVKIMSEL